MSPVAAARPHVDQVRRPLAEAPAAPPPSHAGRISPAPSTEKAQPRRALWCCARRRNFWRAGPRVPGCGDRADSRSNLAVSPLGLQRQGNLRGIGRQEIAVQSASAASSTVAQPALKRNAAGLPVQPAIDGPVVASPVGRGPPPGHCHFPAGKAAAVGSAIPAQGVSGL